MSNIPKKYSCKQCGHPFEAYQPDDNFTFATTMKCQLCEILGLPDQVERKYECDNCDVMNIVFWHVPKEHTVDQRRRAYLKKRTNRSSDIRHLLKNDFS